MIGLRRLSLMFKEYYEQLYVLIDSMPTGDIFSVNIPNSICYALGMANDQNKGAVVNNLLDVKALHEKGMRTFYIPIDTLDGREGLSVYEARMLAESIHALIDKNAIVMGLITNGCINDKHIQSKNEWEEMWQAFNDNLSSLSVGGSYWLNKVELLPPFVKDIRIGRFMLFGFLPYSAETPGKNCMVVEGQVLGVNLSQHKIMVDMGDAYCDPTQCEPYKHDLTLTDVSSNYALYSTPNVGNFYVGQRLLFTPNYKHSSALSKLNVKFDYE